MTFYKVVYRDRHAVYSEMFSNECDAREFMRSLKRSPDLIEEYVLYEICTNVDHVKCLEFYEV